MSEDEIEERANQIQLEAQNKNEELLGDMTSDELSDYNHLMRTSPLLWYSMHGVITTKDGPPMRMQSRMPNGSILRPNILQIRLLRAAEFCHRNRLPFRVIVCKPRQTGISTVGQALLYHTSRRTPIVSMTMAHDDETGKHLQSMFERYAEHDQFDWGDGWQLKNATFKFENGSIARRETANKKTIARGRTDHFHHFSEVAHYPSTGAYDAKTSLLGATNAIARTRDTWVLIESTPNGIGDFFHSRYHGDAFADDESFREGAITLEELEEGKEGNGWVKIWANWWEFTDYRVVMDKTEAHFFSKSLTAEERTVKNMYNLTLSQIRWRRQKIKDGSSLNQFLQEYPEDPEMVKCFLVSGRPALDQSSLQLMHVTAQNTHSEHGVLDYHQNGTIEFSPIQELEYSWFQMWERPIMGARYIVVCDPMTGEEQVKDKDVADRHSVLVLRQMRQEITGSSADWSPLTLVARIRAPFQENTLEAVNKVAMMARFFGDCTVVIEKNNAGHAWITEARKHKLRLYRRKQSNKVHGKLSESLGWDTNNETRSLAINALTDKIFCNRFPERQKTEGIDVFCLHAIREMVAFIIDEKGKAIAPPGLHDDDCMALAIGCATIDSAIEYRGQKPRQVIGEHRPKPNQEEVHTLPKDGGGQPDYLRAALEKQLLDVGFDG